MANKKIKTKEKLDLVEFLVLVQSIANGYFNEDEVYMPHIGFIDSLRFFYNFYVIDSEFEGEIPHDFSDLMLINRLVESKEFMDAYNNELVMGYKNGFTFGRAFFEAMKIVKSRNNPIERALIQIANSVILFLDNANETMNDENISKISEFVNQVKNGNLDYIKLMKDYGDSEHFDNLLKIPVTQENEAKE